MDLFSNGILARKASSIIYRFLIAFFPLIVLAGVGHSQAVPQKNSPTGKPQVDLYTIKVSVEMVVLSATVRNHKGTPVSGLDKDDFQVYEDGVRQEIKYFSHEDIPVTVGLVVDNSGSMAPKLTEVIAAALAFARSSNPQDQMFVVNFNEHVSFALPHDTPFTDQQESLKVALSRINADGRTALYDAVVAALEHLKAGNRDKKVLVVVSDGADNASKHTLAQVLDMAGRSNAIVYTLGLFDPDDPDKNPGVLKRIAQATGGEAFLPESLGEVVPICQRIAHDIRNQYTIAYVPTNGKLDGTFRAIQIRAGAPGSGRLFVRTRPGYNAPLKTQLNAAGQGGHP
ncbi:MAG: VWA domain-containing protein [Terriglobia bacterium]